MIKFTLLCFVAGITLLFMPNDKPIVKIKNGSLQGIYDQKLKVNAYLGIPYAKPPTGERRWKAPEPAEDWDGIREAHSFGFTPIQENIWGDMYYRSDGFSEDCLYLNVWTPAEKSEDLRPVLVYFYGGGFVAGDGSEPRYDGASMASKGIVSLTVNYRLNIFGFFAHPQLSKEAEYAASGNYGLLDQAMALQWVRDNIRAFGGDPDRVTIAGESAGSISVSSHMASPLSKSLINGAIGESGAAIYPTLAPVPLKDAEQIGNDFLQQTGLTSIEQLRAMTAEELYKVYKDSGRFGFPTVIDGYFFPASLPEIFNKGNQAEIPLLCGWNSAEIPGQAFMQGLSYSPDNFRSKVKETYPEHFEEILALYPHSSDKETEWSATNLASDRFIAYSTWKWADLHARNSKFPVYRYVYGKKRPEPKNIPVPPGPSIGAPHACEIEYAMGNLYLLDTFDWTEEDYSVSAEMQQYFVNFIKTGNPNGSGLPEWPELDPGSTVASYMYLDIDSHARKSDIEDRYQFHDRFYKNL